VVWGGVMGWSYYQIKFAFRLKRIFKVFLFINLHSNSRHLIELRMAHGDLDALIDKTSDEVPLDELMMRRLKKRRLALRDEIARLERTLTPDEPA
jgi:hypothetical protein